MYNGSFNPVVFLYIPLSLTQKHYDCLTGIKWRFIQTFKNSVKFPGQYFFWFTFPRKMEGFPKILQYFSRKIFFSVIIFPSKV